MNVIKWILRLLGLGLIGFGCLAAFDSYRGGYFSMPDLMEGEYPVSFKSGLRAIVVDADVPYHRRSQSQFFKRLSTATPDRRYIGIPYQVASWFEDRWSYCQAPSKAEANAIRSTLPPDLKTRMIGARLDAVCTIDSDGETIPRGLVFSVPR